MTSEINAAEVERWACALGGAALAIYGTTRAVRERSVGGAMVAAAGGSLIARAGMQLADRSKDTREALSGSRGILVDEAVTVNRSPEPLYVFWRNFELLPCFMQNVVSVCQLDATHSHWIAKAPAGRTVEWDAEIINEIPFELIGWRTLEHADVVSAGSVRFTPINGRGTEVRVRMQYNPPGGKMGAAVASLFGDEPSQTIREDLRRFKCIMETGELPTTAGQPRGR
jgi:uncharacterized membrane protein